MANPSSTPGRRGRPATTSAHRLAEVARALLIERGYHDTTIEDIAAAAGVNKRTFFRYFTSKADVLWDEPSPETARYRQLLSESPQRESWRDALHRCGPAAIHYTLQERAWMLRRAELVFSEPAVREKAAVQEDAWRLVATRFVAERLSGHDEVLAIAAGHAALGALLGAHEYWVRHTSEDLTRIHERFLDMLLPHA